MVAERRFVVPRDLQRAHPVRTTQQGLANAVSNNAAIGAKYQRFKRTSRLSQIGIESGRSVPFVD